MSVEQFLTGIGIVVVPLAILQWLLSIWIKNRLAESIKNEYAKNLEEYRGKVRKGEFVFQKKLELLGKMSDFSGTFIPIRESPDDCWSYGRGMIIARAGDKELELRGIIATYGYLLQGETETLMHEIKVLLNSMKFELTGCGIEPTKDGEKMVDDAISKLEAVVNKMKTEFLGNVVG